MRAKRHAQELERQRRGVEGERGGVGWGEWGRVRWGAVGWWGFGVLFFWGPILGGKRGGRGAEGGKGGEEER